MVVDARIDVYSERAAVHEKLQQDRLSEENELHVVLSDVDGVHGSQ
jgi:hypothetical protein